MTFLIHFFFTQRSFYLSRENQGATNQNILSSDMKSKARDMKAFLFKKASKIKRNSEDFPSALEVTLPKTGTIQKYEKITKTKLKYS